MTFLALMVAGFLSILFVGGIGRFVASSIVASPAAPVAGFSFACGCAFVGGFRGIDGGDDAGKVAVTVGMALALTLLWYLYFKREKA